ncbi:MAG: hypothetical protein M3Y91_05925 [Actinomycetota bacterium]|nr:hypothetical protein [Actinomycetota bacterium]
MAALALAVHAVVEAEDPKGILIDVTRQVLPEQLLELLDVRGHVGGDPGVVLHGCAHHASQSKDDRLTQHFRPER